MSYAYTQLLYCLHPSLEVSAADQMRFIFMEDVSDNEPLKWGDSFDKLSDERKQELRVRLLTWTPEQATMERLGPFFFERLNGLEVYWLAACALAGADNDPTEVAHRLVTHNFNEKYSFRGFSSLHLEGAILDGAYLQHATLFLVWLTAARLQNAQLSSANLAGAHLEGANLSNSQLPSAVLAGTRLDRVNLTGANLEGANLSKAHLESGNLSNANLDWSDLTSAQLRDADLHGAHIERANLSGADLERADLRKACLDHSDLDGANLEQANLSEVSAQRASLRMARLQNSSLYRGTLEHVNLFGAHLEGANLIQIHLNDADLRLTVLDSSTRLNEAVLTGVSLDQAILGNTNLSDVEWGIVPLLGDEWAANKSYGYGHWQKPSLYRAKQYQAAARAYRMLAINLQSQGIAKASDHYSYRCQVMHRKHLWHQRHWGGYLWQSFLSLSTGYGYRLWRIIAAYGLIVVIFAALYLIFGQEPLNWRTARDTLQVSFNAVHGRVIFVQFQLGTWPSWLETFESIIGIGIEAIFVAALIQKLFSR